LFATSGYAALTTAVFLRSIKPAYFLKSATHDYMMDEGCDLGHSHAHTILFNKK